MKKNHLLLFLLVSLISCTNKYSKNNSETKLYLNGDILTMRGNSPEYVDALIVKDKIIQFVGSKEEAMKIVGNNFKSIDLKGNTLLPGFIDGHAHFASFSAQAIGAQILPPPDAGAKDIPSLIEILKKWNTPENRALTGWIFGMGFDDSVLEEKRFPTKHDLDQVSTEFPIMIVHISGHFAVVNSKALELLKINSTTKNPEGGIIRRENGTEPNGVLEELAAIPYMLKVLNPTSKKAADQFFEAGQEMALSYGYTTAQEGRAMENHELLVAASQSGKLKLDVVSYVDYLFVYLIPPDGAKKGYLGYPAIPKDSSVMAIYEKAFKNNWQIHTHANGDAAMDQMIRTMKPVVAKYGNDDRRNVLIHGQYIREDQLDSFKDLDVIASLFPLHTFYWGDWHKQIIGDSLGNTISPTRTALNKGLKITIHTDAPVALPNLMRMVGISVDRKSRSGQVIGEKERLTTYEALLAITSWSAYQHFEEHQKGTLEVGKLADMIILEKNPLKVSAKEIKKIKVLETIKDGVVVYKKQ